MRMKEESGKAGLKFNIQKTRIMASGPITSWEIGRENVEAVTDFIFLDSKIAADGWLHHGIKRHFLLGRKAMTNLDSILKSIDITLLTKICIVKAMVFPVVMYRCESCTIKKAESQRTDAFELWCWRTLSSLDCNKIKPANPKGNQPWLFIGRFVAESDVPILWPSNGKSWLIGNYLDAVKDWRQTRELDV